MPNAPYAPALHSGWYLAAMVDELTEFVTPLAIGDRRLMIVRGPGGTYRVYNSVCPHRGADLGHGGVLSRAGVICPFHGKAIALGERDGARYWVSEVPSFLAGTALFAALDPALLDDNGFRAQMTELASTHQLFACPPAVMAVPQELVVENAFDLDHFIQVHRIPKVTGIGFGRTRDGAAYCEAALTVRTPVWDASNGNGGGAAIIQNRFYARAFSPSIVMSELGPAGIGQTVITTASPVSTGCRVRVINALRPEPDGSVPARAVQALTDGARKALEQDRPVWENLTLTMEPTFDPRDEPVLLFREFCSTFSAVGLHAARC